MLRPLGTIALVAAAYYLAGRLGLLLAIPPGYATAVWPAAGIALAAAILLRVRALPGVFLGSFLVNLPSGLELKADPGSLWLPMAIALGATLQAGVGAGLIRRWVHYRNLLVQELDAVRLLLIGGPLACLINASVGVGSLLLSGKVAADAVPFNWFTWWVGDSIGVLIFTTLVLIWGLRPTREWLRRQLFVSVPLLALALLVVGVFVFISQREQLRIASEFQATAQQTTDRLREDLAHTLTVLSAVEGYFAATGDVSTRQFEIFAGRLLPSLPGGVALSWNPVVQHADREGFEKVHGGIPIFERNADGTRRLAPRRKMYVPVAGIVPGDVREAVLGFNVWSDAKRRLAMEQARDSGRPRASRRVELVQWPGSSGVLVYLPIFGSDGQSGPGAANKRPLLGYAVGIFEINGVMSRVVRRAAGSEEFDITLTDESVAGMPDTLYQTGSAGRIDVRGLVDEANLEFAGRRWRLSQRLAEHKLVRHRSWESWLVLAGGLALTSLAGMMLLMMTGRSLRVETLVEERTAALRQSEAALQRKAMQLVSSNAELEQFAYIASHDLKAPLRSIGSFAQLLERRAGADLRTDAVEFLGFIRDGVRQMQGLVDDLLRLSRVEAKRLEPQEVELGQVVEQVRQSLSADITSSGAILHVEPLPGLVGDPRMLAQLFQNLISNALKFQLPGRVPEVWISAKAGIEDITVEVRDNGIGVEPRFLEHIFQLFKRLHTPDQYSGTGLGLAICRKIVQLHGGEIRADSTPGNGLTVRFSLARTAPTW